MSNSLKRSREEAQPDVGDVPNKRQKISENNILDYLHEELVQQVLVFVPHRRVGRLRSVCKLFNNIIQSQEYWRRKSIEVWGANNVIPELRALSLSASSDALLSNTEYLIPFIKDGSKTLIHWKQYFHARMKLRSFVRELVRDVSDTWEYDFRDVKELKIEDIESVLDYVDQYEWDLDDPVVWPEGNKFQNKFCRLMFDCTAEILLVCINNGKWDLVERITRDSFSRMDLPECFLNHEAVCVKLLDICEALQDKATYVVPFFHKAVSCFKVLKETTKFTKRVYRRLVEQQIKMGSITSYDHIGPAPTKHMHFRYPQKSFQAIQLTKIFPKIEDLKAILLDVVSKVYYDPKSDWRLRASALAALRTVSIPTDDKLAYSSFEFAYDAIKSDNEEVQYAGLVLLYEITSYCGDIKDQILDEHAIYIIQTVARQIRKQVVQHRLFLVEILAECTVKSLDLLSDQLLDELIQSILWLLQQPGVINRGTIEYHSINRIYDLGGIYKPRFRPYLPAFKEVLFKMAVSPDLKADLITNEEILAVYYKLLMENGENSDQEGKELINQVLQNSIGFEVRHPQFFALCGQLAQEVHFPAEEYREQTTTIIKAMLAVFSEQINLYGQSLYPDVMLQDSVPSDIPNSLEEFAKVATDYIINNEVDDRTDLAEFFNFEATPESKPPETTSPYVVKVNFVDAYENEFDRVAIRAELASYFCSSAIDNLLEIALRMKTDFLPFAQTTLHIMLAFFRANVPPRKYLPMGIGNMLELLFDELGDYDKIQYAKILTHRLDFLFMHYLDTLQYQDIVPSLNNLYIRCTGLLVRNPFATSGVIKSILDFFMDIELSLREEARLKAFFEMVRMFMLSQPRKTYIALLNSRLKDNSSLLKAIETDSPAKDSVFRALSYIVTFFGLDYTLNVLNSKLPAQELLKKVRDSSFKYYTENKAALGDSLKIIEVMLLLISAAIVNRDILEFRFFQAFFFRTELITNALEALIHDEEVKQQYGTGSDEFDKFIADVLNAPGGFMRCYWTSVSVYASSTELAASLREEKPE